MNFNKQGQKKNEHNYDNQILLQSQAQQPDYDNPQLNEKDIHRSIIKNKSRLIDTKDSTQNQLQQQISILDELILNDKGEKVIYKMRPSKVIQHKCYRIVDLRQQRIKVLSNTKENTYSDQQNLHSATHYKNKSNFERLQTPTQTKSIFQQPQNSQNFNKRGTSITGLSTNLSNVTPVATNYHSNLNVPNEFDGRNQVQGVFQFQMDKGVLNDAGISSSRNQFIFSEKYIKNLSNKRISMSREKYRIKAKGSQSQMGYSNNNNYQLCEGEINHTQLNTTANSKRKVIKTGQDATINSVKNNQTQFISDPSHRVKNKQSYLIDENPRYQQSSIIREGIKIEQEGGNKQNKSNLQCHNLSSKQQSSNFIQNQQSVSSCAHRKEKNQENLNYISTTSQGFYNTHSTKNHLDQQYARKTSGEQFYQNNSQSFQNINNLVDFSKTQDQDNANFNLNTTKSVLFKQISNFIHFNPSTKKLNSSGINIQQTDQLASSTQKTPIKIYQNNLSTATNIQKQISKEEKDYQEMSLQELIKGQDLTNSKLQNRNQMRGCTSESSRKYRKLSSNITANQSNQLQYQQHNNMMVLNLTSRPSTATNILAQNKVFRDQVLNTNLFKKQIKSILNLNNSNSNDIGLYFEVENQNQQNGQLKTGDKYTTQESTNYQNSSQLFNQQQHQNQKQQQNKQEESKFETLRAYSQLLKTHQNKKFALDRLYSKPEVQNNQTSQIKECQDQNHHNQKKQINNLINQMFKKSFFPQDRYPSKVSEQMYNSQIDHPENNQIIKKQLQPSSKILQQFNINKQILYSNTSKPLKLNIEKNQENNQNLQDYGGGGEEEDQLDNANCELDQVQQLDLVQIQDQLEYQDTSQTCEENPQLADEKYQELNQYYHKKYTNFKYLPDNKIKQQNIFSKTQNQFNNKLQSTYSNKNIKQSITLYDKFEPWENDDKTANIDYDENE